MKRRRRTPGRATQTQPPMRREIPSSYIPLDCADRDATVPRAGSWRRRRNVPANPLSDSASGHRRTRYRPTTQDRPPWTAGNYASKKTRARIRPRTAAQAGDIESRICTADRRNVSARARAAVHR